MVSRVPLYPKSMALPKTDSTLVWADDGYHASPSQGLCIIVYTLILDCFMGSSIENLHYHHCSKLLSISWSKIYNGKIYLSVIHQ